MIFDRFTRALPILAVVVSLAGCVTIAPQASPTVPPIAVPTASPAPTATPLPPPTDSLTPPPTTPPTAAPPSPPTAPPTAKPTAPPTAPVTAPPGSDTLDPNQDARYGSLDPLDSGFAPDPMQVSVTSGGTIDASYLGGGCLGYAEPNPDYEVHYSAGAMSLLRFYFVPDSADQDATLIVNDAATNWVCSDDTFGTKDPAVDFSPPAGGWYDIWIGSYSADAFISGTLYITELDSNHP